MPTTTQLKPLFNQTAIVTGASSGIGEGIARAFATAGANVVVNYVGSDESACTIVDEIVAAGGSALSVHADVSQENDVQQMFRQTLEEFKSVDILVANAGIQQDARLTEMTIEQWNRVISVNLTGQFLCVREAVKQFLQQGIREGISCAAGKIICMSSVHQVIPWAGHVNYATSKGGINMMMQSVAQEVSPFGIDFIIAEPGPTATGFTAGLAHGETMQAYADTPAAAVQQALRQGTFVVKGSAVRTVDAMIAAADSDNPPLRLALGSTAYKSIRSALAHRLQALETQRGLAFSADSD